MRRATASTCVVEGCTQVHRYVDGYCQLHRELKPSPVVAFQPKTTIATASPVETLQMKELVSSASPVATLQIQETTAKVCLLVCCCFSAFLHSTQSCPRLDCFAPSSLEALTRRDAPATNHHSQPITSGNSAGPAGHSRAIACGNPEGAKSGCGPITCCYAAG